MKALDSASQTPQLDFLSRSDTTASMARRLWVMAAERSIVISQHYRHAFVDSTYGGSMVGPDDLLLVRDKNGSGDFAIFRPFGEGHTDDQVGLLAEILLEKIAASSLSEGSRSAVTEMLVISSRPARWRDGAKAGHRVEHARSHFEEMLFRLEQQSSKPAKLSVLNVWQRRFDSGAHPMVRALFHRIFADALADEYRRSGQSDWYEEARRNYRLAQISYERAGLLHHLRTAHLAGKEKLAFGQLELPGFEMEAPRQPSVGFSVERLCGFSVLLDNAASATNHRPPGQTATYRHCGTVNVSDATLIRALSGLHSPSRRLVASANLVDGEFKVRAGVVDEMLALLRVDAATEPRVHVNAIRVRSDTISFEPPSIASPSDFVTFSARPAARRFHDIEVRAMMADGLDLCLSVKLDARNQAEKHYL